MKTPDLFTSRISKLVLSSALAAAMSLTAFGQAAPPLEEPPLRTENNTGQFRSPLELMKRADQYEKEKRYPNAAELWQSVIDESQETVSSKGERQRTVLAEFNIFRPLLPAMERQIAEKPKEALDAYRLRADGEAKALLAKAETPAERKDALVQIANRFFLSNLGDDAVMELSGESMENFEFVTAERLLKKLVNIHPNPSVDLNQAKLQLAMAAGRNNNTALANKLLEELRANQARPAGTLDAVEKALAPTTPASQSLTGWSMAGGSQGRDGLMPALPEGPLSSYKLVWEQPFTLKAPAGFDDLEREEDHFRDETELLVRWTQRNYRPATTLRFGGSSVFFQNDQRLVGFRARDGRIVKVFPPMGYHDPNPGARQQAMRFGRQPLPEGNGPKSQAESQLFFASLEQSVMWQDHVVFVVERPPVIPRQQQVQGFGFGGRPVFGSASRTRSNRLVAYGANPRKVEGELWAYQPKNGGSILGEPVPFRNIVVVPVLTQNRVDLVALDQATGNETWRAYLCEEQIGSVAPYAEAVLAVGGDDIYALSGNGILGAFEGASGNLHWVLQHARSVTKKNARFAGTSSEVNGWQKNHLIVSGPNLIVAPSDMEHMFAADRRTGMIRWRQVMHFDGDESTPYPLGIKGDNLYVASSQMLRMQQLKNGRMIKVRPDLYTQKEKEFTDFFESYGRGALTEKEILIPNNNEVLRFDHELNLIDRAPLNDDDSIPLGNLFSDGKRLYQVGLRSVQAFEPVQEEAKEEEEEEEAKPTDEKDVTP